MEANAKLFRFTTKKGKEEGRLIRQHVTTGRGVRGAVLEKKKHDKLTPVPPGCPIKNKYNETL